MSKSCACSSCWFRRDAYGLKRVGSWIVKMKIITARNAIYYLWDDTYVLTMREKEPLTTNAIGASPAIDNEIASAGNYRKGLSPSCLHCAGQGWCILTQRCCVRHAIGGWAGGRCRLLLPNRCIRMVDQYICKCWIRASIYTRSRISHNVTAPKVVD